MARTYQRKGGTSAPRPSRKKNTRSPAPSKRRRVRGGWRQRLLRWVVIFLLCCVVGSIFFVAGGYVGLVRSVGALEEPEVVESHPTYIYSEPVGEGEGSARVIGTVFGGMNHKTAPVERMPATLLDALVAKEDERYRHHGGVDLAGILRALWVDIRAGETVEGASTITQQYVKNAYLSNDQTWRRKVKEALMAIEIERRYPKDEILGMYLNTVYFGSNAYGVEAAAETYFNKSADDLSLSESAALIGVLWSPSTLGADREGATYQRNLVLDKMRRNGYITRQDHMAALEEELPQQWPQAPMVETGMQGPPLARDFAEVARGELVEMYGSNTVLQGGLSVYTTLDLKAQAEAREILYGTGGYLPYAEDPDAALVSIEPETGHIKTMVGNRDGEAQFNLVTQAQRQPGSSFKPFALIAALEQGIDPKETTFTSEEKSYTIRDAEGKPEKWEVENYEGEYLGPITLEKALHFSDNSVFTDLVLNVDGKGLENGPQAIADVANRLGVTAELDTSHPSIVLGAQEVSPMDMATAYATIANGGRKVRPTAVKKVVRDEGEREEEVLYEAAPQPEGEQVVDPEIARQATEIMIGDVTEGIAYKANLGAQPLAGKTGTSENFFDSWFLGYTPNLVTGVWMGYAEGGATLEGMLNIGGDQLGPLAPPTVIFQTYMRRILGGQVIEKFEGVEGSQVLPPNRFTIPEDPATVVRPDAVPPPGAATPEGTSPGGPAMPAGAPIGTTTPDTAPQAAGSPTASQYGAPAAPVGGTASGYPGG